MSPRKTGTGLVSALIGLVALAAAVPAARAQFLRLGPFDIKAQSETELVYSTNVEGERKSEATKEREDYYVALALSLTGGAPFGRGTQLDLDTQFGMEKHFVRTDLDSENAPFGRFKLNSRTEAGRYTVGAYGSFEREYAENENRFVPGGRKKRDVTDTTEYGADVGWQWTVYSLQGSYDISSERHQDEIFQDGDKDEHTLRLDTTWDLRRDLKVNYSYERSKTVYVHPPETEPETEQESPWETTERISLDWNLPLLERPSLTYSLGLERETEDGESDGWDWVHTFTLAGEWDISPVLHASLNASYEYEQQPEESKDIAFTYGATLDHEISRTSQQSLSAKREPVETFGSTAETDNTTVDYRFTKKDLFIYNLNLQLGVSWTRDEPLDNSSPVEKVWTYSARLVHDRALTRKLTRQLAYDYELEDSSLETELLEEHRITLKYTYTF